MHKYEAIDDMPTKHWGHETGALTLAHYHQCLCIKLSAWIHWRLAACAEKLSAFQIIRNGSGWNSVKIRIHVLGKVQGEVFIWVSKISRKCQHPGVSPGINVPINSAHHPLAQAFMHLGLDDLSRRCRCQLGAQCLEMTKTPQKTRLSSNERKPLKRRMELHYFRFRTPQGC